jgi:hypothetical protein
VVGSQTYAFSPADLAMRLGALGDYLDDARSTVSPAVHRGVLIHTSGTERRSPVPTGSLSPHAGTQFMNRYSTNRIAYRPPMSPGLASRMLTTSNRRRTT